MPATTTVKAQFAADLKHELRNILGYWSRYTPDVDKGGFYGEVDNFNNPIPDAAKGSVLNARILWTFSAAYRMEKEPSYLAMANRAFTYIRGCFIDIEFGGVYWSLAADGSRLDTKKQIYALAFTIYGLSEYHLATGDEEALSLAISLYHDIENHSFDKERGGYFEALTRDWQPIADLRLSDKDANEKKTMNTHLHILEAYTNLYRVWRDEKLAAQIKGLLSDFEQHITNNETHHLNLFFDENWVSKSTVISYGHDIEASWLLMEAAEVLGDEHIMDLITNLSMKMAQASTKGLNDDGSLNYEYDPDHHHLIDERHWWVQAEAMVGFYNAFEITGDESFFNHTVAAWEYTQQHIIDTRNGEWFWGVNADGSIMKGYGKAGFWKCPYHNGRACMEMIRRLEHKAQ